MLKKHGNGGSRVCLAFKSEFKLKLGVERGIDIDLLDLEIVDYGTGGVEEGNIGLVGVLANVVVVLDGYIRFISLIWSFWWRYLKVVFG